MALKFELCGVECKVDVKVLRYLNGNLAILLIDAGDDFNGEEFGTLTVNLGPVDPEYAALDTNNLPSALDFCVENGLGTKANIMLSSGFCSYPLVKFDIERLRELDPEGVEKYLAERTQAA